MRRLRPYLFLAGLLLTLLACLPLAVQHAEGGEPTALVPLNQGTVTDGSSPSHRTTAVIGSHQGRYRLCNTRQQRVLPTHGSHPEHTPGRLQPACRHSHSPLSTRNDRRWRLETAPFQSAVSRLYYVIALRHLRC